MKPKILQLSALLSLSLIIVSCGGNKDKEATQQEKPAPKKDSSHKQNTNIVDLTAEQFKTVGVQTGQIENRALSGTLKVNGLLDVPPQNLISITAQMGGIVQSTPLLQGSIVRKGQVIAVLQNPDYVQLQQDYLDTKGQLEFSETEFKRQQELANQQVNSQKTLQQAKAQYYSLQAKASGIRQKLLLLKVVPERLTPENISGNINVYSPVDGYVTKVGVNVGKYVNSNDVMFEIVNGSNLHVELNVFEKDLPKLKVGQKVRFKLANETAERTAVISLIGREINPDKTVRVHSITSDANGGNFIPGTYLSAYIETNSIKVDALPNSAVVDFEGKKYVFVSKAASGESYHFEMVEISTGITEGNYIEVDLPRELKSDSTKIVTKGAYDLLSKMKNSEEE